MWTASSICWRETSCRGRPDTASRSASTCMRCRARASIRESSCGCATRRSTGTTLWRRGVESPRASGTIPGSTVTTLSTSRTKWDTPPTPISTCSLTRRVQFAKSTRRRRSSSKRTPTTARPRSSTSHRLPWTTSSIRSTATCRWSLRIRGSSMPRREGISNPIRTRPKDGTRRSSERRWIPSSGSRAATRRRSMWASSRRSHGRRARKTTYGTQSRSSTSTDGIGPTTPSASTGSGPSNTRGAAMRMGGMSTRRLWTIRACVS